MAKRPHQTTTRRDFLRLLTVTGGALAAGGLAVACAPTAPPPAPAAKATTAPAATAAPASKPGATVQPTTAAQPVSTAGPTPRRGGTLVYASSADVVSLDPPYVSESPSAAVVSMVYDYLVRYTPDLEIKPDLATSWAVNETVWTFNLRNGVTFHDGTPFNAHAVKDHFERLLGPEKPLRANNWTPYVDRIDAVDEATVRFHTKFPDAFFLTRLADSTGAIESPEAFKKFGKDLARNPVGTGPFKFVEWAKDDRVVVARNDAYWGEKAHLDRVTIRPIAEAEARAIALEAGDVQLAIRVTPEQIPRLERNPNLTLEQKTLLRNLFIGMHVQKKPFDDVKVRQALNHAIDKESIVKNLYQGLAEVLNGAVPAGSAGYVPMAGFAYDPAKAKQLLAEAGYPNGFSVTMVGPSGRYLKDSELQQAIQQQLKAVGVDVKLETVEWARYLELLRTAPDQSPLELWLDAWSGVEAAGILKNRYGCQFFRPTGGNTHGFCNQQIDEQVAQAEQILDEPRRDALLKAAQETLSQQAPSMWLLSTKEVAGMSKKLHNPVHMKSEVLTVDQSTWLEA